MFNRRLTSAIQYLIAAIMFLLLAAMLLSCGGADTDPDIAHLVGSDIHAHQDESMYQVVEYPIDYGVFRIVDFEACVVFYHSTSGDVAVAIPEHSALYQKCLGVMTEW